MKWFKSFISFFSRDKPKQKKNKGPLTDEDLSLLKYDLTLDKELIRRMTPRQKQKYFMAITYKRKKVTERLNRRKASK